jgi:hypothetical protein
MLQISRDALEYRLNARADRLLEVDRVSRDGIHVIVPFLWNGARGDAAESARCYAWILERGGNRRTCILLDVMASRLDTLRRLDARLLETLVQNLFGELDIEPV